jgi:flagellar protein FliL
MATEPDNADTEKAATKSGTKGGMIGLLVVALLLTTLAGGVGFLGGHQLKRSLSATSGDPASTVTEAKIAKVEGIQILPLPPIVTNLAGEVSWVRIEASVLIADDKPVAATLAGQLAEDITALVRTLSPAQIGGASGYQHLREELLDRLRTRTDGKSRDISIQSMIIE